MAEHFAKSGTLAALTGGRANDHIQFEFPCGRTRVPEFIRRIFGSRIFRVARRSSGKSLCKSIKTWFRMADSNAAISLIGP